MDPVRIVEVTTSSNDLPAVMPIPIFGNSKKLVIFIGGWGATKSDLTNVQLPLLAHKLPDWAWCSLPIDDTSAPSMSILRSFNTQAHLLFCLLMTVYPEYEQVMIVSYSMGAVPALRGARDFGTLRKTDKLSIMMLVPPSPDFVMRFIQDMEQRAYYFQNGQRRDGYPEPLEGYIYFARSKDPITVVSYDYVEDLYRLDLAYDIGKVQSLVPRLKIIYAEGDEVVGNDYQAYKSLLGEDSVRGSRGNHAFDPYLHEMFRLFEQMMLSPVTVG